MTALSLVPDGQATVAEQPRDRPLGLPAVPAEALAGPHGRSGDARDDVPLAQNVPFTAAHAVDVMDWKNVGWPVAHAAAIAWQAVKAGETLTVLSLEPELYAGTGMTPLNLPDPLFSRVCNRPITDGISRFHDREVRTNTPVSPAARHCSFPPRADHTITFGKRMMSESDETGWLIGFVETKGRSRLVGIQRTPQWGLAYARPH